MVPLGAHQESAQNQQGQPGPEQSRGQVLRACGQERGRREVAGVGRHGCAFSEGSQSGACQRLRGDVGQGQENRDRMRGRLRESFKAKVCSFQKQPEVTSENGSIFT